MAKNKHPSGAELLHAPEFQQLTQYAQIIPEEILDQIKTHAQEHGVSLEVEMASVLLASFVETKSLGLDTLSQYIMNYKASKKEAENVCKQKRQGWLYIFEKEKLRLYLSMKNNLPRSFKERYTLIDVKTETKHILEEQTQSRKKP